MSLSAWFPGPAPLKVAGRVVLASQLRLRDLATLEAFVVARLGGPVDSLDPLAETYADDLRERYDTIEDGGWPPSPSSPEWSIALFTDKPGLAMFLAVVLRETPNLDCDAVAESITDDEFAAIEAIAWAAESNARDAIVRAIDKHLGLPAFAARDRGEPGMRVTWAKAIADVVAGSGEVPGLGWASPEVVGNLTISQWRMICRGGEDGDDGDPLPEDADLLEKVNEARRGFFGPIGVPVIADSIQPTEDVSCSPLSPNAIP